MKHFDQLILNPKKDPVEMEFTVETNKYKLLIPKQYLTENCMNYIWDNFDKLAASGADFAIPNVDFEKIANE